MFLDSIWIIGRIFLCYGKGCNMLNIARDDDGKRNENMVSLAGKLLCPFIRKPFDACYCASTSSIYTEATIHYCGGNFEQCEIYKENVGQMI
jgi:hypothetical protein